MSLFKNLLLYFLHEYVDFSKGHQDIHISDIIAGKYYEISLQIKHIPEKRPNPPNFSNAIQLYEHLKKHSDWLPAPDTENDVLGFVRKDNDGNVIDHPRIDHKDFIRYPRAGRKILEEFYGCPVGGSILNDEDSGLENK